MKNTGSMKTFLLPASLVAAASMAAYGNALPSDFVYDASR
jgi:hypothetical protein